MSSQLWFELGLSLGTAVSCFLTVAIIKRAHTRMHAHTHAQKLTHTHAHTHSHAHTHTHTHTHTQALTQSRLGPAVQCWSGGWGGGGNAYCPQLYSTLKEKWTLAVESFFFFFFVNSTRGVGRNWRLSAKDWGVSYTVNHVPVIEPIFVFCFLWCCSLCVYATHCFVLSNSKPNKQTKRHSL